MEEGSWKKIILIVGLIGAFLAVFFVFYNKNKGGLFEGRISEVSDSDYTIPGVPYIGIHNHVGSLSYATGSSNTDSAAAVISIMEYWYPQEVNYSEIRKILAPAAANRLITAEKLKEALGVNGKFKVEEVRLKTTELSKYINEKTRTPLAFHCPLSTNQPEEITLHPLRILIGVNNPQKKVIVHDYWLGNNYEISFEDLDKMWELLRPDQRNAYIVVQPIEMDKKLAELNDRQVTPYSPRTSVMEKGRDIMEEYFMGAAAYYTGQKDLAMSYYQKAEKDPMFNEYLPPLFHVVQFQRMAQIYLEKDDVNSALTYINRSIEENHDLDKPFKDWPGYEVRENRPDIIDRTSYPYRILGDILYAKGDFNGAKDAYTKSLEINPSDTRTSFGLRKAELEIAKVR